MSRPGSRESAGPGVRGAPGRKKGGQATGLACQAPELSIKIEELSPPQEPLVNVFTFGWMEDGRLGYKMDNESCIQAAPRPIASTRHKDTKKSSIPALTGGGGGQEERYVTRSAKAGARHTIILMENCYPEGDGDGCGSSSRFSSERRKKSQVLLAGLNQRGLCEEKGFTDPVIVWNDSDEPIAVAAGNGTSFIITKIGNLYSFGNGRYGMLGHGDEVSSQIPRQVKALQKVTVTRIAVGSYHAVMTTEEGVLYSWGRNNKGQLGRGVESPFEVSPAKVAVFEWERDYPQQVCCGHEHTLCLLYRKSNDGGTKKLIFAWGDHSRGQLGSGDEQLRCKPQENRWVTKLMGKYRCFAKEIAAGSHHNLVLTSMGQVVSWGAGDYGQLGHGSMWDDDHPKVINDLNGVTAVSAGSRHSAAIVPKSGVLSWGYNGYGELGLGDTNIRTQPTVLTCFSRAIVKQIDCGDRHTVVVTTHRAVMASEDPALRPFFSVVEEGVNQQVVKQLKVNMEKAGFDSTLLDDPYAPVPNQVGVDDNQLRIDKFDKGLRYCMDSFHDPADWRRKSYEVCFEARLKGLHLKSVCLACARQCQSSLRLTPYVRVRTPGNTRCYCKDTGMCVIYWSVIRSKFDLLAGEDGCIMPKQIKKLLQSLRAPVPVEIEDVGECLVELAESAREDAEEPRIAAVPFEKWYRRYYDEFEDAEKA